MKQDVSGVSVVLGRRDLNVENCKSLNNFFTNYLIVSGGKEVASVIWKSKRLSCLGVDVSKFSVKYIVLLPK